MLPLYLSDMAKIQRTLKTATLMATYHSGLYSLISRRYSGVGAIWGMHRVVDQKRDSLATNLTITAAFLDRVLAYFKSRVQFVTMDEVRQQLIQSKPAPRPFIALTFDDGYQDNLKIALPILRQHGVPATVYVSSGGPDRRVDPWPWRLEKAILDSSELSLDRLELPPRLAVATWAAKKAAYDMLVQYVHQDIPANRHISETLLLKTRVSDESLIVKHFLSWDELEQLAADPLITIGGHTVTHASLRDLDEDEAMTEIAAGRERLKGQLGVPVSHFAYPYGARSNCDLREFDLAARAGYATAVTGRHGNIFPQHRHHLMCLPRLGLGGDREQISSTVVDVSGAPIALGSRWRNPIVTV